MAGDGRVEEEEELVLPLVQVPNRWEENRHVAFLLAPHLCGGVLTRGGQVRTVLRAIDFHETLGGTTHRTDRLAERGAGSTALSPTAGRARHTPASHTRPAMDNAS
jgi:hypothetical protein